MLPGFFFILWKCLFFNFKSHNFVPHFQIFLFLDSDVEMTSPVKTLAMERKAVPMKAVKQLITAPRSETAIQKHRPSIHSRLNARGPSPVSRTLVKERLKMGAPDTSQPNSVKARLGVNKPDTSIKNRLGVQQQMENSEKSNADDAGSIFIEIDLNI